MELTCKYGRNVHPVTSFVKCDWCGDILCPSCGYKVQDEKACNECYVQIKNCGHSCTSNCRRVGCNCDCGEYHKDLAFSARAFSKEQLEQIKKMEKECVDNGCDDTGHKHD